jgi:hypothetical protein
MPTTPERSDEDNDFHKGAKEEDRARAERNSRTGVDQNGLPNDPVATAEDSVGARIDESQG